MKITNIFLGTFILFLAGCTLYEKITDDGSMEIVNAGYHIWSQPPVQGGDVPERGIDLAVIVSNWPKGATPSYFIYNNKKSSAAAITTTSEIGVVINARIVQASSVLSETSQEVEGPDRLVFIGADGDGHFIEIEEWMKIELQEDKK